MNAWRHLRGRATLVVALLVASCAALASSTPADAHGSPYELRNVRLQVLAVNVAAPFNVAHALHVPVGWTAEVWARVAGARFAL